jgi:hypothetical protein
MMLCRRGVRGWWLRVILMVAAGACCAALPVRVGAEGPPAGAGESPGGLKAKRLGPPEVDPVVIGKLRFETLPWGRDRGLGQNGGYIVAYDDASGEELWILKVYGISYDPTLEQDVQDVFIASMSKSFFGGKLRITDEQGRHYTVDPDTRTVVRD